MYPNLFIIKAILSGCYFCRFVETDHRNEDKAKQKEETALLQDEQKKVAKNVDELKDQVERQSTALQFQSQILATQC